MAMVLIKTETLLSNAATISISSIPSTYKDLYLLCSLRCSLAVDREQTFMNFNGNTQAIYSSVRGYQFEGGQSADTGTTYTYVPLFSINGASVAANVFSPIEAYIFNYSAGTFTTGKQVALAANSVSTSFVMGAGHFAWNNTSVVSSLSLSLGSGNFVTGSSISLYGIS